MNLIEIISSITVFQLVLLAVVLSTWRGNPRLSHRLLAAFLLVNAWLIANFVAFGFEWLPSQWTLLYFPGVSSYLLFGPLLYGYTRSVCYPNFKLHRRDWLHGAPFLSLSVFLIVQYLVRRQHSAGEAIPQISGLASLILETTLNLQIFIYLLMIGFTLRRYRQAIKQVYSAVEQVNLTWLLLLFSGFALMWLCDLAGSLLARLQMDTPNLRFWLTLASLTINLLFATSLVYKGLKQPEILAGVEDAPKYSASKLTPAQIEQDVARITNYMETRQPYLDPGLTLHELAGQLSISYKNLSQEINEGFHQNFFDFINHYRIEEAKRRFQSARYRRQTILEILYAVGFNSKSVFNAAFKKQTGQTPTDFRRRFKSVGVPTESVFNDNC